MAAINISFHQKKGAPTHTWFSDQNIRLFLRREFRERPPKNVSNLWEFLTSHQTRSRLSSGGSLLVCTIHQRFFLQNRWTFVCVRLWKFEVFQNRIILLSGSLLLPLLWPLFLKILVWGLRQKKSFFLRDARIFYWQFAQHNADDEEMTDFSGKGNDSDTLHYFSIISLMISIHEYGL